MEPRPYAQRLSKTLPDILAVTEASNDKFQYLGHFWQLLLTCVRVCAGSKFSGRRVAEISATRMSSGTIRVILVTSAKQVILVVDLWNRADSYIFIMSFVLLLSSFLSEI